MLLCSTQRAQGHIHMHTHTHTDTHRPNTQIHAFISLNQINLSYAFGCYAKYFSDVRYGDSAARGLIARSKSCHRNHSKTNFILQLADDCLWVCVCMRVLSLLGFIQFLDTIDNSHRFHSVNKGSRESTVESKNNNNGQSSKRYHFPLYLTYCYNFICIIFWEIYLRLYTRHFVIGACHGSWKPTIIHDKCFFLEYFPQALIMTLFYMTWVVRLCYKKCDFATFSSGL